MWLLLPGSRPDLQLARWEQGLILAAADFHPAAFVSVQPPHRGPVLPTQSLAAFSPVR
jgi:hypothetical protein